MPRTVALSLALIVTLLASPGAAMPLSGEAPAKAPGDCWQRLPLDRAALGDAPLPVGALVPCPGVRPGARVWIENGGCTLNFVFRGTRSAPDGSPIDEGLFIGTAGHCIPEFDGEQTWAPGEGPVARDSDDKRFGEVAYGVIIDPPDVEKNLDFALIRVDEAREKEVNPSLCHFGGPAGLSADWELGDVVHHFGQGLGYENTVQGRSGVLAAGEAEADWSAITFAGAALFGDSGSALIEADGDALAVVVAILPPLVFATPIATQVERAESKLGMDLELVRAPLAP